MTNICISARPTRVSSLNTQGSSSQGHIYRVLICIAIPQILKDRLPQLRQVVLGRDTRASEFIYDLVRFQTFKFQTLRSLVINSPLYPTDASPDMRNTHNRSTPPLRWLLVCTTWFCMNIHQQNHQALSRVPSRTFTRSGTTNFRIIFDQYIWFSSNFCVIY